MSKTLPILLVKRDSCPFSSQIICLIDYDISPLLTNQTGLKLATKQGISALSITHPCYLGHCFPEKLSEMSLKVAYYSI